MIQIAVTIASVFVAAISCVIAIASFSSARKTASIKDGKEEGGMAKDIEYIKTSVDRIEKRQADDNNHLEGRIDEISKQMILVAGTAGRAHESSKTAHNRLNEHLEREHQMTVAKIGTE